MSGSGESDKVTIYAESDGSRYEVEYPPTSKVDLDQLTSDLGLPGYIDMNSPMVANAIVALWASYNVDLLSGKYEGLKFKGAMTPLLMGGIAVKFLSKSSNEPGPMNRLVKDIDYIVKREHGGNFLRLLDNLSKIAGSRFYHFLTSSDKRFNALRAGDRYRIRTVDWTEQSQHKLGWVDILVDKVEMRHKIDVRDEFARARENVYTIGVEKLLMTKCQMIEEIDKRQYSSLQESGQEFRVLNYPYYKEGKYLIGMEEKDMMDTAALLCDFSDRSDAMAKRLALLLSSDEKLLLTFRLNLENLAHRVDWLRGKGLSKGQLSRIEESLNIIARMLPNREKRWDKPWWNKDIDTPKVY
jgi:hypothetical protein